MVFESCSLSILFESVLILNVLFSTWKRLDGGAPRTCWRCVCWWRQVRERRRKARPCPRRYTTSRTREAATATRWQSHGRNWILVRPLSTSCPGSGRRSILSELCQVHQMFVTSHETWSQTENKLCSNSGNTAKGKVRRFLLLCTPDLNFLHF